MRQGKKMKLHFGMICYYLFMTEMKLSLLSKVQPLVGLFSCVVLLTSADRAPETTLDNHGLETVYSFITQTKMCSYLIMLMSCLVIRMNNNKLSRLSEKIRKPLKGFKATV